MYTPDEFHEELLHKVSRFKLVRVNQIFSRLQFNFNLIPLPNIILSINLNLLVFLLVFRILRILRILLILWFIMSIQTLYFLYINHLAKSWYKIVKPTPSQKPLRTIAITLPRDEPETTQQIKWQVQRCKVQLQFVHALCQIVVDHFLEDEIWHILLVHVIVASRTF